MADIVKILRERFPWLGDSGCIHDPAHFTDCADVVRGLAQIYSDAVMKEPKVANLVDGDLVCVCGTTDEPKLVESGYTLDHHIQSMDGKTIYASGGEGRDFSESGDLYALECYSCFAQYKLPEGYEVEWI